MSKSRRGVIATAICGIASAVNPVGADNPARDTPACPNWADHLRTADRVMAALRTMPPLPARRTRGFSPMMDGIDYFSEDQ